MSTPSDHRGPDVDESAAIDRPNGQHAAPDATGPTEAVDSPGMPLYAERPTRTRDPHKLVPRPPEMWGGAIFLTLAALPLVILGGGLALLPGQFGANLREKLTSAGTSVSADSLIVGFRVGGVLLLVLALVLIALAWLTVRPRSRARIGGTVLAALEVIGLAFAMIVTVPDPVSIGMLLLAAAGVVLFYLPRSEEFMLARR